jgi:hypothetical protein
MRFKSTIALRRFSLLGQWEAGNFSLRRNCDDYFDYSASDENEVKTHVHYVNMRKGFYVHH